MKALAAALVAAAALTAGAGARAQPAKSPEALLKASGCASCHTTGKRLVGPAYREVAARYRGSADAEERLVKKVKAGGRGAWGDLPMPPNAHVKDEDLRAMVRWILSLE
ncbi:MAG: c-type cytochrome [Dehalococcoidia bacterium]|nr:c-type cytochrome [Dehalococcoidia bacterium]